MQLMGTWRFAWILIVCLGLKPASAQTPHIVTIKTPTIGNITSVSYVIVVPQSDYSYPHVFHRDGTNINITVSERRGTGGFTVISYATNTAVLGELPPGNYQLVFQRDHSHLFSQADPFYITNLFIPDIRSKALSISRNNDTALISLRGITNGLYTIDCANKLGEWAPLISTNLSTNQFPFTITNSISAPAQYYRVRTHTNASP